MCRCKKNASLFFKRKLHNNNHICVSLSIIMMNWNLCLFGYFVFVWLLSCVFVLMCLQVNRLNNTQKIKLFTCWLFFVYRMYSISWQAWVLPLWIIWYFSYNIANITYFILIFLCLYCTTHNYIISLESS